MNRIMEWLNMHVVVYVVELESSIKFVLTFCFWSLWGDMGSDSNKKNKSKMSRTEMESFSLDTSRFSRDFLTRFMGSGSRETEFEMKKEEHDEEEEDVELNLGLSLGGRFGVDRSSKKLMRSSSIAACLPIVRDDDAVAASSPPVGYSSLVRTSSLPVETEEEWRKRKELQTLRRMEAKRRRSEKQRNSKAEREGVGGGGGGGGGSGGSSTGEEEKKEIEANLRGRLEREQYLAAAKRFSASVAPPFGVSTWAASARHAVLGGGIDVAMSKGKGSFVGGNLGQLLSQGSVESQGGSSSSELESKPLQGSSSCGDLTPGSIQLSQKGNEQDAGSSRTNTREGVGRTSLAEQVDIAKSRGKETRINALEDMPCVFTKGDGPNGRRVEGILYKYGKGEEVRIMCVCHGSFLSPAEFVKHAGGTDVTHPLKHIVVNPNASPFL